MISQKNSIGAVMQPYIFPYLGYFQLIKSVDCFVFYDDVNYIKNGWINRNNILLNGEAFLFSVPISKSSSYTEIKDTFIHKIIYEKWLIKFTNTLYQCYKKAPYFDEIYPLIIGVLENKFDRISELAASSVLVISDYLNIDVNFYYSSIEFNSSKMMERDRRIVEITKKLGLDTYINSIGGTELYDKDYFRDYSISLKFLDSKSIEYQQFSNKFVPNLSIIDVLMFNDKEAVKSMLNLYELKT